MGVAVSRPRSGAVAAALIAAATGAVLLAANLPTADGAAHLYRTALVRDGAPVWDNLWYGGHYPLASYSLLYYLPAAVFGNTPLVIAAGVIAAALFASVVHREWPSVGPWPACAFAVVAVGPLFTGTYSYALGLAALLGSIRALQAGRPWLGVGCAALTLGFSPLAFVLLCLVLGAVFLTRRRDRRRTILIASAIAGLAGVEVATLRLFPYDGVYPFSGWALFGELSVGGLGLLVSLGSRRARPLAAFFVLWLLASAAAYTLPTPLGANLARVQLLLFPLTLLAALLADLRPRLLVFAALVAAFVYNVVPYGLMASERSVSPYRSAAAWTPVLAFLQRHATPDYRVEVVPTREHWEAYYVPKAGYALARGWYRQLDLAQNPLLYRPTVTPAAYRAWLRSLGVRYVLLPRRGLDGTGAQPEATLLESRRSGLVRVLSRPLWEVFELPRATPILSGPARSTLTTFGHVRIRGRVAAPGEYTLRVRYMPYWHVTGSAACIAPGVGGRSTLLRLRRAGPFALASVEQPGELIEDVVGTDAALCAKS